MLLMHIILLTLDLDAIGPDLRFIEYTLIDTLPGCDNDGRADAGETIQIYFTVKNVAGFADSTWSKIRFGEFEDTTTAQIIDSTSYLGNISTWATLTGELSLLEIRIDSNVSHNRDIVFEYEIGCKNSSNTIKDDLIVSVEKGVELSGITSGIDTLYSDFLYLVNSSFRIGYNSTLYIEPGTEIVIYPNITIDVKGNIKAMGTKESPINIRSKTAYTGNGIMHSYPSSGSIYSYCNFYQLGSQTTLDMEQSQGDTITYCSFEECLGKITGSGAANSVFSDNIIKYHNSSSIKIEKGTMNNNVIYDSQTRNMHLLDANSSLGLDSCINNIFYNIAGNPNAVAFILWNYDQKYHGNCIISCSDKFVIANKENVDYVEFPNIYWGTSQTDEIQRMVLDFWDWSILPILDFEPKLDVPSPYCHGIVWKIEINDVDPQDEILNPIGSETVKFDVYFNRAMDTAYPPLVGFGVIEPFLQRIVIDSAQWSSDSTMWTAYYTVGPETGDGINTVHVRNARDPEGFEIPPEKYRFKFVIQASSAASVQFYATPGIGKVELEWPPTPTEDALGYNLYRSYNLTDSTYSDTLIINTELILDTVYTDYNVIPDTTYHYHYKTLGTDMVETDYSKRATATPFDAANGDANGDLAVNVLDITTIVSYMLNQNPSPFLFDAADVNYDNDINVLDIIGLVQLINGGKSLSIKPLPEFSKQTAYYNTKDNVMRFESKGNVGALQFKLKVKSGKLKVDKLKIFSLENGFEFSYGIVGDEIIGILYSMSGKEIPKGISSLFRFEGIDVSDIEITEIFGGDLSGNYVPVLKKGENASIIANQAGLQVNPNPFSNFTQINYLVPENGIVSLRLHDLTGAEIKSLTNSYHQSGNHTINWDGTNSRGQLLKPGIYLLQIKVESVSGNNYNKEVKVVFTR